MASVADFIQLGTKQSLSLSSWYKLLSPIYHTSYLKSMNNLIYLSTILALPKFNLMIGIKSCFFGIKSVLTLYHRYVKGIGGIRWTF